MEIETDDLNSLIEYVEKSQKKRTPREIVKQIIRITLEFLLVLGFIIGLTLSQDYLYPDEPIFDNIYIDFAIMLVILIVGLVTLLINIIVLLKDPLDAIAILIGISDVTFGTLTLVYIYFNIQLGLFSFVTIIIAILGSFSITIVPNKKARLWGVIVGISTFFLYIITRSVLAYYGIYEPQSLEDFLITTVINTIPILMTWLYSEKLDSKKNKDPWKLKKILKRLKGVIHPPKDNELQR